MTPVVHAGNSLLSSHSVHCSLPSTYTTQPKLLSQINNNLWTAKSNPMGTFQSLSCLTSLQNMNHMKLLVIHTLGLLGVAKSPDIPPTPPTTLPQFPWPDSSSPAPLSWKASGFSPQPHLSFFVFLLDHLTHLEGFKYHLYVTNFQII